MMGIVFLLWLGPFVALLLDNRKLAVAAFALALLASLLMYLYHATDKLGLNL